MPDDIFHSITRADVWAEIQKMSKTVNDIRSDQLLMKKDDEAMLETLKEHNSRLRGLDLKFYGVIGGLLGGYGYVIFGG